jgi:hypothetical protein
MNKALIDIDTANALKRRAAGEQSEIPNLVFRCQKCDQPVAAHNSGQGKQGPHFEHIRGNPDNCPPKK